MTRDFGLAGERRGKASEKPLTRLLVDPAVASRKQRPKLVAAPPVATFPPSRGPPSHQGQVGGTETTIH
jgi:hypothetical protein